jgi:TrmH family RNA methyltransferase
MFIVEGMRELARALAGTVTFDTIFFCGELFRDQGARQLISGAAARSIPICELSRGVFEKISNRENCDGVLGLANFWETKLADIHLPPNFTVLVAEGIEKAGNLGALMRSAESAGVEAMILCDPVTDIFNPNVVRASQGAIFSLPIAVAPREETLLFLTKNAAKIFALTPAAKNFYFGENFTGNTAIIVGSERDGLSDFWLKNNAIGKIALPQMGACDSLNVNDAAVVVLYEILRQKGVPECSRE